ncbi:MAG TPA: polyphenol oxidase family protein [Acidimicrobiales bacterium]|nr:polyphenol oxidase family protein [Acidimicrobiales bacterium]
MITTEVGDGFAHVVFTTRDDGDMGHGGEYATEVDAEVAARRRTIVDLPWTWLRQVHGSAVVHVTEPGGGAGQVADAVVSSRPDCPLVILTADCAPVALASPEGIIGAVHAGWAGLVAGVIGRAVDEMRTIGASDVRAVLGPTIHPECYEFGDDDLKRIEGRLGPQVRSRSRAGAPALDLPGGVGLALRQAGVEKLTSVGGCTACDTNLFSWRARRDKERQAMVVWR